jgi:hypothetical protein
MTKPATDLIGEPALTFEQLGSPLGNPNTPRRPVLQLRCELVGTDEVTFAGLTAPGAFDLCRQLVARGVDPTAELLCFRDGHIALRIRSIGAGSQMTVRESASDGPRFAAWKPFPGARSARPFVKTSAALIPSPNSANA